MYSLSLILQILVFLTLNSTLNLFNRWLLGIAGFPFPIFITMCHMAFSVVALAPLVLMTGASVAVSSDALPKQPKDDMEASPQHRPYLLIALAGICQAANIATNNTSLISITLTLNQIIRASLPVVTAIMAFVIHWGDSNASHKLPNAREMVALTVLCIGTMLVVWQGTVAGEVLGVTLCVLSTVLNATMMVLCGKVMASFKTTSMMLTLYMAPVSLLSLLPWFFMFEYELLVAHYVSLESGAATIVQLVLLSCVNAVLYNVVHFMVIAATCAVTSTVLGMAKMIVLLMLSNTLLGEYQSLTPSMAAGTVLAIGGFCWYGVLKIKVLASASKPQPPTVSPQSSMPLLQRKQSNSV